MSEFRFAFCQRRGQPSKMSLMKRLAIYYAPREGELAEATAAWFGWDPAAGLAVPHTSVAGLPTALPELVARARKYGFHGTLKAPFRLAQDITPDDLADATARLAARLAPVEMAGLKVSQIDGFFALVPTGDATALNTLATCVVEALDPYRASLTPADIARRMPDRLTERQRAYLARWGYPYVKDEFHFHLTMTDAVSPNLAPHIERAIKTSFGPVVPRPFRIEDLCMFGEDDAGQFHLLARYPLLG